MLWPWARHIIREKGYLEGDRVKLLTEELAGSGIVVTIPKALKMNVLHALEILDRIFSALDTGKMRWSLVKRASYRDAATLFTLITTGRITKGEDAFLAAFRSKFPLGRGAEKVVKKRRRRYRRRRPRGMGETTTSP
jgi:hypothetical protein